MKLKPFIVLLLLSMCSSAQNNKGRFFVETGVRMFGGGDYLNFAGKTGISFNKTTGYYKYLQPDDVHTYSYNNLSFSIAPRIGYYLSNKLSGGIDFQYYLYWNEDWELQKFRIVTEGIFLRYNVLNKKISPFIEVKTGFGISKEEGKETSAGGGIFPRIEFQNLFYYAFAGGIIFRISEQFNLNLSVMGQNTIEKFSDKSNFSTGTFKISNWEIGPMLSIAYIFRNKKENQK